MNRQRNKIREITDTLSASGYTSLDAQASVLGLSRSTTWNIRQARHEHRGLSGVVVNRMLAQPELPALVRIKIIEYVEAKSAGMYGHNHQQRRRFSAQLSRLRGNPEAENNPRKSRRALRLLDRKPEENN